MAFRSYTNTEKMLRLDAILALARDGNPDEDMNRLIEKIERMADSGVDDEEIDGFAMREYIRLLSTRIPATASGEGD